MLGLVNLDLDREEDMHTANTLKISVGVLYAAIATCQDSGSRREIVLVLQVERVTIKVRHSFLLYVAV